MNKLDYFSMLGLHNIEGYKEITKDLIREKYIKEIKEIELKLKQLKENRILTREQQIQAEKKLVSYNNKIRCAYEYCIKNEAICLRNEILRTTQLADNKSLSNIRKKQINIGNIAIGTRVIAIGRVIELDNTIKLLAKLYNIEFINKIPDKNKERQYYSDDGYLDKSMSKFEMIIKDRKTNVGYSYSFYAGGIEIDKLRNDPDYRKILLQELENMQMNTEEKEYLGFISKESDGKYTIVKDYAQNQATKKAKQILEKNKEKEQNKIAKIH